MGCGRMTCFVQEFLVPTGSPRFVNSLDLSKLDKTWDNNDF